MPRYKQTALHEAARAQAVHDRPGLLDLPLQAREVAQRERRKDPGHSGVELGTVMADPARCFSRRQRLLEHRLLRAEVEARMSALAAVRNLDAAEAVLGGQVDAMLQMTVRRDHPAADILGVAETAQRLRFEFR